MRLRMSRGRTAPGGVGRLAAAALVLGALATGTAGCGSHRPRPAVLRIERTDLVLLARTLQRLRPAVASEVTAAREAWPSLADGLPPAGSSTVPAASPAGRRPPAESSVRAAGTRLAIRRTAAPAPASDGARAASGARLAARRAAALALPSRITEEGAVTGPAAKLAGMLRAYVRLSQRGWRYLAAALAAPSGPRPRGRAGGWAGDFLRTNAPLYIYCVYDGHYDLSLVGKALSSAYHALGATSAFGAVLTPGEVRTLARAYSIPATRLNPHPGPGVVM